LLKKEKKERGRQRWPFFSNFAVGKKKDIRGIRLPKRKKGGKREGGSGVTFGERRAAKEKVRGNQAKQTSIEASRVRERGR